MTINEFSKGIIFTAEAKQNAQRTVNFINDVMTATGGKAVVTSTVRTAEHNARIGGVPNSKHLNTRALAVDFRLNGNDEIIKRVAAKHGYGYLRHDVGSGDHIHCEYKGTEKKNEIIDNGASDTQQIDPVTIGIIIVIALLLA